jgi:hypothetical protein
VQKVRESSKVIAPICRWSEWIACFDSGGTLFQEQPDRSRPNRSTTDPLAALRRDAQQLSDEAETLRQVEIDRIYNLLLEEPERWDGLS